MEKKLFDNVEFGDKYLTKGGLTARFICVTQFTDTNRYCLYCEGQDIPYWYDENGVNILNKEKFNIISKIDNDISNK